MLYLSALVQNYSVWCVWGGESADNFVDNFTAAYLPYYLPVHVPTPHPTGIKLHLNLKLLHLPLDPSSPSQNFG